MKVEIKFAYTDDRLRCDMWVDGEPFSWEQVVGKNDPGTLHAAALNAMKRVLERRQ